MPRSMSHEEQKVALADTPLKLADDSWPAAQLRNAM
jgi:hypothetical protein